ncbi:MAG TPA: hypothetical protein VJB36_05450 [Methylomirabilota bacterium]|nr:hypothetical protein [Methylomirabilota bacterium]
MPEDSTRKLLKVFGVSMTDCEDAVAALAAALGEPPGAAGGPVAALEAYGRAARELSQRWVEVSRLILDYQLRAQQAVEAYLRGRGA